MSIDLTTLKEALAPLAEVGKEEISFEVEGVTVYLCPLLPHEEVEVQRYSSLVLEDTQETEGKDADDSMSRAAALDYFDKFRIEVISYAVVQVGSLDLRGVEMVETGEVLDNGVKVRVKRHAAMRDLIQNNWSRSMITAVFSRYGDLVEKLALEADGLTGREPPDMDIEIARMEKRLKDLKEERDKRAKGDPNITNDQINDLVQMGEDRQRRLAQAAEEHARARAGVGKPVAAKTPQGTVDLEQQEAIRQAVEAGKAPAPTPAAAPPPPPQAARVMENETPSSFDEMRSSFEDGEDPEVFAAEEARIMAARRAAARASSPNYGEAVESVAPGPQEPRDIMGEAQPAGQVKGVDAYRLPTQEMTPRGRKSAPKSKGKDRGVAPEVNPNFKPNG